MLKKNLKIEFSGQCFFSPEDGLKNISNPANDSILLIII